MADLRKICVAGATGKIGRPIVTRLLESKLFEVTVLTRDASKPLGFPNEVIVKTADYDSLPSLESALQGQDGLVSAIAFEAISTQINLADAAAKAGVKRMIPSEYGNDTQNPKLTTVPIYQPKIAVRKHLDELVSRYPSFSYTIIMNASFLAPDWTLDFIVDVKNRTTDLKDGGDVLFCATTYQDIAQAVVGIFTHPDETANRPVKISSINTTQNTIIETAKRLGATDGWQITYSNTEDLEAQARERWGKGDHSEEVIAMFINRAFIGQGWGGHFPVLDNSLLGITMLDNKAFEDIVKQAMDRP